jgi:hypothetical protein
MKNILVALILALSACIGADSAFAKQLTAINQPPNKELFASIGDLIVRVTLQEALPNAFGGSDIFGRKRERGSVEIRFVGIRPDGRAVFRRRSIDIFSNETTLSPSQSWGTGANVNQSGNGKNIAIVGNSAGDATVKVMPGESFDLALELPRQNTITVEDRLIEIISADEGGVRFVIRSREK